MSTYATAKDITTKATKEAASICRHFDYDHAMLTLDVATKSVGRLALTALADCDQKLADDLTRLIGVMSAQADFIHRLAQLSEET